MTRDGAAGGEGGGRGMSKRHRYLQKLGKTRKWILPRAFTKETALIP